MPTEQVVSYEVVDRVAVVTIERPAKRNAMSMAVFAQLREAGERAAADGDARDVGAVLVRGAGGTFSAGIDTTVLGGQASSGRPSDEHVTQLQQSFTVFEELDVPSVAAVQGACFGAGLQLALACHVRLVAPDAELSLMEARWGLVPDLGGCHRLPRLVGLGRATEMALTARRVPSDEALAMGLCEVALTTDDPQAEALAYARGLAAGPAAVRRVPRLMRENLDRPRGAALAAERRTQLEVMAGHDFAEAVTAAREGRTPVFTGR